MKSQNLVRAALAVAAILLVGGGGGAPEKTPLTVKRIGAVALDPPLVFPPGSQIRGIELLPGDNEVLQVQYIVRSGLRWNETYQFYRRVYARAKVRWFGRLEGNRHSGPHFAFAAFQANAPKEPAFAVVINQRISASEAADAGLTAKGARDDVIYALVVLTGVRIEWPGSTQRLVLPVPAT